MNEIYNMFGQLVGQSMGKLMKEPRDYYYVYSVANEGKFKIPTKLLFSIFDENKYCVLYNETHETVVIPFDYQYQIDDDDYTIAYFPIQIKVGLSPIMIKIGSIIHEQWLNSDLFDYFNSAIFVQTLQKAAQLRQTGEIKTLKEDQFNCLKLPIVLTDLTQFEYHEIWKDFLEKCKIIQDEVILNRKKFDI